MSALVIPATEREESSPVKTLRRVTLIWALLFLNAIGTAGPKSVIPIPHRFDQLITQGSLPVAFVLALTVNRKVLIRPNWFLGLFSLLAVTSVMMSIRLVSVGTAYRGFRLAAFIVVLWLLTPWWRERGLVLLRSQVLVLTVILGTLMAGIVIAPSRAFSLNYGSARLDGVIWPLSATAVGHYMSELVGLVILLWWCGMIRRRPALIIIGLGFFALLASHTRTALLGLVGGLVVAGLSLFLSKGRVRRTFAISLVVIVVVVLPLSPQISAWLTRGQDAQALSSLSGRTSYWHLVLSAPRPETNKILGSGMTDDGVMNQNYPSLNGLPIDSSWIATYQNQGLVGCIIEGLVFLILLITAVLRPRGPTRALALFLIVYSLISSYTETGMGEASPHLLDLALAASLLVPRAALRPIFPLHRNSVRAG